MTDQPVLTLNDERQMPQLGFGTWQIEEDDAATAVQTALEAGYWLIDTAAIYKNEKGVGEGIGDWSDIFLTTKVWNSSQGFDRTKKAFANSLSRLDREYVDLLLIHWPCPEQDKFVETWKAMIELRDEGTAKSIGVSNFREEDLKRLADETGVVPAINQIELHPDFQQREMRKVHESMGIITQSWSPLGQGKTMNNKTIRTIADETGQDAAGVIIRWHIQHGFAVIPKSTNPDHIRSNFTALDFELTDEQMARIDDLDNAGGRIGSDPSEFES